jgi:hypothetical protein
MSWKHIPIFIRFFKYIFKYILYVFLNIFLNKFYTFFNIFFIANAFISFNAQAEHIKSFYTYVHNGIAMFP